MLEILFGESEACAMRTAKTQGNNMQGSPAEVICLDLEMDIGDIRQKTRVLRDSKETELGRLRELLSQGETARVWYSESPYSICGFYHLCHALGKSLERLHTVKLSEYEMFSDNTIQIFQNWGEVCAERFEYFLRYEKVLSVNEVRMYACSWAELVEDNSPMRAVVNGKLIGVPEEFYDFLIYREITEQSEKESRIIGRLIGKYHLGLGDRVFADRIQSMIECGAVEIEADNSGLYQRVIRRAKKEK